MEHVIQYSTVFSAAYPQHADQHVHGWDSHHSNAAGNVSAVSLENTTCIPPQSERRVMNIVLIAIYTVALVGGVCGAIMMSLNLFNTSTRSVNTTMVINLLVVHIIFLLTVPFRIFYYINNEWIFGLNFCKIVSAMLHIHMYLSFIFYVTILTSRCLTFFKKRNRIDFYRKLHSIGASIAVWVLVIVIIVPLFFSEYGKSTTKKTNECFHFQEEFAKKHVMVLNYLIVFVVLTVICMLFGVQVFIVSKVARRLKSQTWSHQEFWAQMKSLLFILSMIQCFFPTHLYKLYYLSHINNCRASFYNELCLTLNTLSCCDMLSLVVMNYCSKRCVTCCIEKNKLLCC